MFFHVWIVAFSDLLDVTTSCITQSTIIYLEFKFISPNPVELFTASISRFLGCGFQNVLGSPVVVSLTVKNQKPKSKQPYISYGFISSYHSTEFKRVNHVNVDVPKSKESWVIPFPKIDQKRVLSIADVFGKIHLKNPSRAAFTRSARKCRNCSKPFFGPKGAWGLPPCRIETAVGFRTAFMI